jgi:hypothetical protein
MLDKSIKNIVKTYAEAANGGILYNLGRTIPFIAHETSPDPPVGELRTIIYV